MSENIVNIISDDFYVSDHETRWVDYDVTISSDIGEPFKYARLVAWLRDLPADTRSITFNLAGTGGDVAGGLVLFNAFRRCTVPVYVNVIGECHSMTAVLALCGDSLSFHPHTMLHFHNYSQEVSGKATELLAEVTENNKMIWDWWTEILQPFLLPSEIKDLKVDKDVYVRPSDNSVKGKKNLKRRLERHFRNRING